MADKQLEKRILTVDKQICDLQKTMQILKDQYIQMYGVCAWDALFDKLKNTY